MTASTIAAGVRGARSNFYMPMRLMSRPQRAAMFAIYAFARALDDIADGPQSPMHKDEALEAWRQELDAVYHGVPRTPIGAALKEAVARYDLPRAELEALIDGMAMDREGMMVAPPQATLDLYCRRAAGTIGILALSVFGGTSPAEKTFAIALGRALQLTNIARDIVEDAGRGRIYVPREIFESLGMDIPCPHDLRHHPAFAALRRRMCALAEGAYREAENALAACPSRRRLWPALAMMAIYRRILTKLSDAPADAPRARIARSTQLGIALRALLFARA